MGQRAVHAKGGIRMINFDEEIKKFHPSLEIEEAEDAIYNNDVSDITDIMIEMVNGLKGTNNQ